MYSMTQPIVVKHQPPTTYGALPYGFSDLAYDSSRSPAPREPGDVWSDAAKLHALAIYAETGNTYEVERQTAIPRETVQAWVASEDSPNLVAELRNTIRYNEGWRLAKMVSRSLDLVQRAMDEGDAIVNKAGQIVGYKPACLKDSVIAMSILMDKWVMISGVLGSDAVLMGRMDKLGSQLSKMGSALSRLAPSSSPLGPLSQAIEGENLIG